MRWTLSEFIFEMERDNRRKVFFVEGVRDHTFWSKTMDIPRSDDTVIYPISFLLVHVNEGGERGRLLKCAELLLDSSASGRLRFFADADFDRLLAVSPPENVWLTDGRDFESYFFLGRCLSHICDVLTPGQPRPDTQSADYKLRSLIANLARPIGILRLAARRNHWKLPFRRTLEARGFGRFILQSGDERLDLDRLIRTLIQNSADSKPSAADIKNAFDIEEQQQAGQQDKQIVHGKDLVRLLAWYFQITDAFAANFLLMSLATEIALIKEAPNIQLAAKWIETAVA
jgi:hypothetical protein